MNTLHRFKIICLGLLPLISMLASGADIQKCVDAQGKVSYTDKPCQRADKSRRIGDTTDQSRRIGDTTDQSVSSRPAPASKVAASEPTQPAPALSDALRKACDADRLAMREKTVPIADLEKLKNRIATCSYLEIQELVAANDAIRAAEAIESQAEFARKSPECQARWKELSDLQTTMKASAEIEHYIELQRVYERTCPSD